MNRIAIENEKSTTHQTNFELKWKSHQTIRDEVQLQRLIQCIGRDSQS